MAVLLVVTNCGEIPSIKQKTGWYLPEVAHPYKIFKDAGLCMKIVSPLGGIAPLVSGLDEFVYIYNTKLSDIYIAVTNSKLLHCSSGFSPVLFCLYRKNIAFLDTRNTHVNYN